MLIRVVVGLCWALCAQTFAQDSHPENIGATVAEALAVLDLSGDSLIKSVGQATTGVAFQSFQAEGKLTEIADTIAGKLKRHGLEQLDGATFTDEYGSAVFRKAGFHFALTVMPTGQPNVAMVNLVNLGNVDLSQLPKPKGCKDVYIQPASAMYFCDLPVEEATRQCRQLLEQNGWEWFGDTTATFFVRQNAVRLQIMCSDSPAEPGKTAIQFSSELMSSALPTIPELTRVAYSDSTMCLDGDSKLSEVDFELAYRKTMEAHGWSATTKEPITIDFQKQLIFRNAAEELAELSFHPFESLTRFNLKFMTAAQVDRENQNAKIAADQAMQKRNAEQARMENPPILLIDQPDKAKVTESTKQSIEFSVPSGSARSAVSKWIENRKSAGWKIELNVDTAEAGDFKLTNGDESLHLLFMDPGFIPGEITIRTTNQFQLQLKK